MSHTVKHAFQYYLATAPIKAKTREMYKDTAKKLMRAGLYSLELDQLTHVLYRRMILAMLRDLHPSTVRKHCGHLQSALTLYSKDHTLDLPKIDILSMVPKVKRKNDEKRLEESLDLDDVHKLLALKFNKSQNVRVNQFNKTAKRVRDAVVMMCLNGMSVGDFLAWDGVIRKDMKGVKDGWIVYTRIKSGQLAKVPVLPILAELVKQYRWPYSRIGHKLGMRTIQKYCKYLGEKIGKPFTPNTGRHSCGSIMLEMGMSIEAVSKILGHSNPVITAEIYAKTSSQKISNELAENVSPEAMERMNDLMKHLTPEV